MSTLPGVSTFKALLSSFVTKEEVQVAVGDLGQAHIRDGVERIARRGEKIAIIIPSLDMKIDVDALLKK